MARDIDYAATAVHKAIVEKFGGKSDLQNLTATANEKTISLQDGQHNVEGTRDYLLATIRKADSYTHLWKALSTHGESVE